MNTHSEPSRKGDHRAHVNLPSSVRTGQGDSPAFADNRTETIRQRKLQAMAFNSPQVQEAARVQSLANSFTQQSQPGVIQYKLAIEQEHTVEPPVIANQQVIQCDIRIKKVAEEKKNEDDNVMEVEEVDVYNTDEAITYVRDNADGAEEKYLPLIWDNHFLRQVILAMENNGGNFDSDEQFFESVLQTIENYYTYLLEQVKNPDQLPVDLPDYDIENIDDENVHLEYGRQIWLQVEALNSMSLEQWLGNILMNRMKSTNAQVSRIGTGSGIRIAQTIDQVLRADDALAVFFMDTVISRLHQIMEKHPDYAKSEAVQEGINAAMVAKSAGNGVYLAFCNLKGQQYLDWLAMNGLEGGFGRNSGQGDNTWFRKKFADDIHLAAYEGGMLQNNAALHNPDQCIGGPMAILWQGDDEVAMEKLQQNYQMLRRDIMHRQKELTQQRNVVDKLMNKIANYNDYLGEIAKSNAFIKMFQQGKCPEIQPKTQLELQQELLPAQQQLHDMEFEFESAAQNFTAAAEEYKKSIQQHLGNSQVNTDLGQAWIDNIGPKKISRIEIILEAILNFVQEFGIESLKSARLAINYQTSSHIASDQQLPPMPDILSFGFLTESAMESNVVAPELSKNKKGLLGSEIELDGRQTTFDDYFFKEQMERINTMNRTLTLIRQFYNIGHAPGSGMNCLIHAVLRAANNDYGQDDVLALRQQAMDLGLVRGGDMFDLQQAGGQAVLEMIQVRLGAFTLRVISVNPITGMISTDELYGQGNPVITILHTGNHFSPMWMTNQGIEDTFNEDVQRLGFS